MIGLEGRINLACSAELKELLLEWLAAGKDLELDLAGAEEIDITILQLLGAAASAAARAGLTIVARASQAAMAAACDSGFAHLPEFPFQE